MITWKTALVLSFLVLGTSAQYRDEQQQQQEGTQEQEGSLGGGNTLDPSVPEPPSQIPETSFVCDGKPYDPGMYADEETGCRVFHMCYMGRKESFICGTGTVFNQEILSCDYPDNVDCAASSQHYAANTELGKASSEPASGQAPAPRPGGQRPSQQGQRPTQQEEFGGAEEPQYAARPSAPAPRPVAAPRPQVRPQAPPRPKTAPRAPPPSRPAPAQRPPSKARPAPAQRPVQQQLGEQNLDYEPTQVVQRRVARQYAAPQESRAFQRRSNRRWSLMSERY